jgi:hypothetical protein
MQAVDRSRRLVWIGWRRVVENILSTNMMGGARRHNLPVYSNVSWQCIYVAINSYMCKVCGERCPQVFLGLKGLM